MKAAIYPGKGKPVSILDIADRQLRSNDVPVKLPSTQSMTDGKNDE